MENIVVRNTQRKKKIRFFLFILLFVLSVFYWEKTVIVAKYFYCAGQMFVEPPFPKNYHFVYFSDAERDRLVGEWRIETPDMYLPDRVHRPDLNGDYQHWQKARLILHEDGSFELRDLPDRDYKILMWSSPPEGQKRLFSGEWWIGENSVNRNDFACLGLKQPPEKYFGLFQILEVDTKKDYKLKWTLGAENSFCRGTMWTRVEDD